MTRGQGREPEQFKGGIKAIDNAWRAGLNGFNKEQRDLLTEKFSNFTYVIHRRPGGNTVRVWRPDGELRGYNEESIVHQLDEEGNLVGRWWLSDKPEGFIVEDLLIDKVKKWWHGTQS